MPSYVVQMLWDCSEGDMEDEGVILLISNQYGISWACHDINIGY